MSEKYQEAALLALECLLSEVMIHLQRPDVIRNLGRVHESVVGGQGAARESRDHRNDIVRDLAEPVARNHVVRERSQRGRSSRAGSGGRIIDRHYLAARQSLGEVARLLERRGDELVVEVAVGGQGDVEVPKEESLVLAVVDSGDVKRAAERAARVVLDILLSGLRGLEDRAVIQKAVAEVAASDK